jgi:8-oxo-dGTP diphosphatase
MRLLTNSAVFLLSEEEGALSMPAIDRIDVWLCVAGLLKKEHSYLVVKKKYGGLKGKWSFPAGFVDPGETVDQAIIREVSEETGISCQVRDILGIRSGVIQEKISDNLIIFDLVYLSGEIVVDPKELDDVKWLSKEELLQDPNTSQMILFFLQGKEREEKVFEEHVTYPGKEFGYTEYKIFK